MQMDEDHMFHLNYAVSLYRDGKVDQAKPEFVEFERLFRELDEETQQGDQDVLSVRSAMKVALNLVGT